MPSNRRRAAPVPLRRAVVPAALLALPLLAAGCGDTARTLGLTRDAPDEFQVVTRAPLVMPARLGELPPPRPGAQRPQELTARQQGESTLVPSAALAPSGGGRPSGSEAALLAQAPGTPAGGDIRRQVDADAARQPEQPPRTVLDRLLFWQEGPPPGVVVDPERERRRLQENAALGRPPTDGETPIVQPRERALLDGIRLF